MRPDSNADSCGKLVHSPLTSSYFASSIPASTTHFLGPQSRRVKNKEHVLWEPAFRGPNPKLPLPGRVTSSYRLRTSLNPDVLVYKTGITPITPIL